MVCGRILGIPLLFLSRICSLGIGRNDSSREYSYAALKGRSSTQNREKVFKFFAGESACAPGIWILKSLFQNRFVSKTGVVKMYYFAWFLREIFVDWRTHFADNSHQYGPRAASAGKPGKACNLCSSVGHRRVDRYR